MSWALSHNTLELCGTSHGNVTRSWVSKFPKYYIFMEKLPLSFFFFFFFFAPGDWQMPHLWHVTKWLQRLISSPVKHGTKLESMGFTCWLVIHKQYKDWNAGRSFIKYKYKSDLKKDKTGKTTSIFKKRLLKILILY